MIPSAIQQVPSMEPQDSWSCRCSGYRRDFGTTVLNSACCLQILKIDASYDECTDDLNRVCADLANAAEDTGIALATISDNNIFFETKREYAKEMVTGFIRLNGMTVGAVANRSKVYDAEGNAESYGQVLTVDG